MAEKRKFAALAGLSQPQPIPAEPPAIEVVQEPLGSKGRGRPATGKRSNPDYKLYAHYLRKRTHRAVQAKLAELHADNDQIPDLSDLVQELLEEWLLRQGR